MHCLRRKNTWQVDPRNSWRSSCRDDDIQVRFIFYFSKLFFLSSSSKNILEHHLSFFFAMLCCRQTPAKHKISQVWYGLSTRKSVKSWDSMPFDLLARQCCPKTCGFKRGDIPASSFEGGKFEAWICCCCRAPPPLIIPFNNAWKIWEQAVFFQSNFFCLKLVTFDDWNPAQMSVLSLPQMYRDKHKGEKTHACIYFPNLL